MPADLNPLHADPASADTTPPAVAAFIARWQNAGSAERANYALFLTELCDILDVPRPDPAGPQTANNAYTFERAVTFHHRGGKTSTGRIDLYKRGCFVLEAKQYAAAKTTPDDDTALLALDLAATAKPAARIARDTNAWDDAMLKAQTQAERYARSLPNDEDPPPFLIVVDVGHVFELYADFTQKGKSYLAYPDARSHRIRLADLAGSEKRELLRLVWTNPVALDLSKISAAVTREVAGYLAELAKSFEKKHDSKLVAEFLTRCLFCMFAEDVGLLPKDSFLALLDSMRADTGGFVPLIEELFRSMDTGAFSTALRKKLLAFNGGVFASARALPVNATQLGLLRSAALLDWRHVEPAIFGTLLERALSPDERHKLGAHYTPRSYVERLVLPAVIEPLRDQWQTVRAIAILHARRGDLKTATDYIKAYHRHLCAIRVLDPACGSGNFLYVALEHMKRLEGEVITFLRDFGETETYLNLETFTVDPHQFLGIELNPRAAAIAELVLWIGYLQWHFRVHGDTMPAEPVLKKFHNIENRDAVLAWEKEECVTAAIAGANPKLPGLPADWRAHVAPHTGYVCVWDHRTYETDPATKREIPDTAAIVPLRRYTNPRPAVWPEADYIVGNPPFLGDKVMKQNLGDGYVETLRSVYKNIPESADFVMYWWHKAAMLTVAGKTKQFGFVTTNSIRQIFNRRVVQEALDAGIEICFAIPDHPWVDAIECAAVRIAMTVGRYSDIKTSEDYGENAVHESQAPYGGKKNAISPEKLKELQAENDAYVSHHEPRFLHVTREIPDEKTGEYEVGLHADTGKILADISIGANVTGAKPLRANESMSINGMMLAGRGFVVTQDEAEYLGMKKSKAIAGIIRPLRNGRDLTESPRGVFVIDLFGYTEQEAREKFPRIYHHVFTRVKPERDHNNRAKLKRDWWMFGEPRKTFRAGVRDIKRYIATVEVAKHRVFQFLDREIIPEHVLVAIVSDDAFHLGVLISRIHAIYALAAGGTLEDRPRYNKTRCFDPFPFPDCTEFQKNRIRKLAEEIDKHRKRAQKEHNAGLTGIYNLIEKYRAGIPYTDADRHFDNTALVSTLRHLHDELDAAVSDAYGWPTNLTNDEILARVVALNAQRSAEEAEGQIRWLRPAYQIPLLAPESSQPTLALDDTATPKPRKGKTTEPNPKPKTRAAKPVWTKDLATRLKAVETVLSAATHPMTPDEIAAAITRAKPAEVREILTALETLARIHPGDQKGTYLK